MPFYTEAQKQLQSEFDSRALADRVEEAIVDDEILDHHRAFIESRDFFFLSTVNDAGEPTVSYKGGEVGTVTVIDSRTVAFPAYDGNGMFLSLGNIDDTAKIGLLFIDFVTPNRMRLQATARIVRDDPLMEKYPGALAVVRASVDKMFLNCARYVHRHGRVATSPYVPDKDGKQPYPAWKRIDLIQDVLRERDQGKAADEGGVITTEQYGELLHAGKS